MLLFCEGVCSIFGDYETFLQVGLNHSQAEAHTEKFLDMKIRGLNFCL